MMRYDNSEVIDMSISIEELELDTKVVFKLHDKHYVGSIVYRNTMKKEIQVECTLLLACGNCTSRDIKDVLVKDIVCILD